VNTFWQANRLAVAFNGDNGGFHGGESIP
jgi:hypothetical protein